MTYGIVSVVTFLLLALVPSEQRATSNATGTLMLAIAWPIVGVALIYFGLKKLVTGRGMSARYGDFEAALCIVLGCAATIGVLYLMGDPTVALLVKTL